MAQVRFADKTTAMSALEEVQSALIPDTISAAFTAQVVRTPEKIAVCDENRTLSYAQLDQLANTIASQFPEMPQCVGVVMDHSVEMIASILAVLKVGAAYVPAEPSFPPERIKFMMAKSEVAFVITQQQYVSVLSEHSLVIVEKGMSVDEEAQQATGIASPQSLAYVLYTSGTTGYPKGVAVEQRNVCHYARAFCTEFSPRLSDVMLQNSVCTFDIFVEEVFPILLSGGSLAVPDASTRNSIDSLMDFVENQRVTIMSGFPYLLAELNKLDDIPKSLRLLISGGDVLKAAYVSNLLDKAEIYNTYGPTETTVCATYFRCNGYEPLDDGTYPIGKAVQGVSFRLLDENLMPVKEGDIGEICIFGAGVSRGYLENEEYRAAFTKSEDGQRFYRSGDLGRMLPDGNLAFIKRNDKQIMIMGKRVEPQEVESVLERNDYVEHAVVATGVDEIGHTYMTAYIIPTTKDFCVSKLRSYLLKHIPEYMVPEYFVMLAEYPLNPSGKLDRRALPIVMKGKDEL